MRTETYKKDGDETTKEVDVTTERETQLEYEFKEHSDLRWWKFACLLVTYLFLIVMMLVLPIGK
jgi:hypothetical protein